jgi:hypothetical protein
MIICLILKIIAKLKNLFKKERKNKMYYDISNITNWAAEYFKPVESGDNISSKMTCTPPLPYITGSNYIPKEVIFQGDRTIVKWKDGTTTIVKCMEGDEFNKEMGFTMALAKKIYGKHYVIRDIISNAKVQLVKDK